MQKKPLALTNAVTEHREDVELCSNSTSVSPYFSPSIETLRLSKHAPVKVTSFSLSR